MTDESTPKSRTLSRRRLLRTTAGAGAVTTLGGIAGCTGGDGGDGGGDTGDGGDGGSGGGGGPFSCTNLTSGYETYDSGEIAFVFDVDLPETVIDNAEYDSGFNELDANRATANGEKLTGVTVKMNVIGGEPNIDPSQGVVSKQSGTLSFNGEDRPVYTTSGRKDVSRIVELPYDIDGETNYFKTSVIVGNEFSEMTEECEPTFDEVAQTVVMSLTLNEDTTIESEAKTYE